MLNFVVVFLALCSFELFYIFDAKALLAISTKPHIGGYVDHYVVTVLGNSTVAVQANNVFTSAFRAFYFFI